MTNHRFVTKLPAGWLLRDRGLYQLLSTGDLRKSHLQLVSQIGRGSFCTHCRLCFIA